MRKCLLSAVMGVLAMTAVNAASGFTGIMLPFSGLSLILSAVLGIPGVTGMLIINYLII